MDRPQRMRKRFEEILNIKDCEFAGGADLRVAEALLAVVDEELYREEKIRKKRLAIHPNIFEHKK